MLKVALGIIAAVLIIAAACILGPLVLVGLTYLESKLKSPKH